LLTRSAEEQYELKSKWNEIHFKNDNPIILELACGRGEYCLALGEKYPNKNYIGVDIKGARIWKGAIRSKEKNLENVAFLRAKIEFCGRFFGPNEVDEIWITFPDPFLKSSKFNRRLTSPNFLEMYKTFLKKGGFIHLKTDSDELYDHTLSVLQDEEIEILINDNDIYSKDILPHPDLNFKTYYEFQHLAIGKKIKYLQFKLNS
jgi:tRNA (guanine-N7-)-methyltransferase